ncbi:MAG: hypothetical protein IIB56_00960 [Planctomycetes bacterium]|nr:hypothetical protein [Planctomycetota bacterium]MCH8118639.1 hypothetical protein [Planctomycetota bacterium]
MKVKKILFYLLAVLLGGCVPVMSLHSLYTKENVVFEEKLLGTWVDDPNGPEVIWEFTHIDEPKNAYKLIFSDDKGKKGSFVAHLVKLENSLFLDVFPDEFPCDTEDPNKTDWLYNVFFLVPVHTFIKIDSIEPQLKMRLTDDDKMAELLKEDPNAVKHTSIEDRFILTASTKELQAFVLKYADDNRVFTNEVVLNRRETGKTNTLKAIEP